MHRIEALAKMRTLMASLYPTEVTARQLLRDSNVDVTRVDFTPPAQNMWFNIIDFIDRSKQVPLLIPGVGRDYPSRLRELTQITDILNIYEPFRTLYLQQSLSDVGQKALAGKLLFDTLSDASQSCRLSHVIREDQAAAKAQSAVRNKDDIVSTSELNDMSIDVLYVEGGLFGVGSGGPPRVPTEVAKALVRNGCVLVVSDVDINAARFHKNQYDALVDFWGASIKYINESNDPVSGRDRRSNWDGDKQIVCRASEVVCSDWLRPAYDKISEICVGMPVRLEYCQHILASGNRTTEALHREPGIPLDLYEPDTFPWASVNSYGGGFVVFMAGRVSGDTWNQRCPNNRQWIKQVVELLVREARQNHVRQAGAR